MRGLVISETKYLHKYETFYLDNSRQPEHKIEKWHEKKVKEGSDFNNISDSKEQRAV